MFELINDRLTQLLIKNKLVKEEDILRAIAIQSKEGGTLRQILIRERIMKEEDYMSLVSSSFYIPVVDISRYKIEEEAVHILPEKLARRYTVILLSKFANTLIVAVADPFDVLALDHLRTLTGSNIEPVLSKEKDIVDAIDRFYVYPDTVVTDILKKDEGKKNIEVLGVERENEEFCTNELILEGEMPSIVKMVNLILIEALKKRASDIHLEPEEHKMRVRYRIDGNLQPAFEIPKKNQNAVLARLKIMSGMNITEFRKPQDGRFKIKVQNKEIDFRVSALPISYGTKMVLRVLDKSNLSIGLDKLGFSEYVLTKFKDAILKPFGMILVTGPTGSGKSTTLYSIINQLNVMEKSIITIEDPVEYQIDGITQIQTNSEIGLTFASGLRSLLRQSPDIIMVGEIRDSETADIAIKASLTGQLVFSTLHTNDAVSAISRLIDMGIEPFLIASSLVLIAAQRLCRTVCMACKQKSNDCKICKSTGYYGRQAVLEVLVIDDRIREMIVDNESIDVIKKYAISQGMQTLRDDAMEKSKKGVTTMDEVIRVTSAEER